MKIQHRTATLFDGSEQGVSSSRLLWLNADRVFYTGLLGAPTARTLGAYTFYVSLEAPNRVSIDAGPWESGELVVVPPYVPHRIVAGGRLICKVVIEAETIDPARLPSWVTDRAGAVHAPDFVQRVRQTRARLLLAGRDIDLASMDFDRDLFGEPLAGRAIDPRIEAVLARIKGDTSGALTAEELALSVDLSFSRFLHLFKQETGTSFRNLRAWKRARRLLHYVIGNSNLTDIALDSGYPDSTHFSHSIRRFYGLKPRDIFAGSRKITLYRPLNPAPSGVGLVS